MNLEGSLGDSSYDQNPCCRIRPNDEPNGLCRRARQSDRRSRSCPERRVQPMGIHSDAYEHAHAQAVAQEKHAQAHARADGGSDDSIEIGGRAKTLARNTSVRAVCGFYRQIQHIDWQSKAKAPAVVASEPDGRSRAGGKWLGGQLTVQRSNASRTLRELSARLHSLEGRTTSFVWYYCSKGSDSLGWPAPRLASSPYFRSRS